MAAAGRQGNGTIAELVGPAGAGKTTLLRALAERNPDVVPTPEPRRPVLFPYYVRHAALLLLAALVRPRGAFSFQEREARAMTYVRAWHAPALRLAEEGKHVL